MQSSIYDKPYGRPSHSTPSNAISPAEFLLKLINTPASNFAHSDSTALLKYINALSLSLAELRLGLGQAYATVQEMGIKDYTAEGLKGKLSDVRYRKRAMLDSGSRNEIRQHTVVLVGFGWASEEIDGMLMRVEEIDGKLVRGEEGRVVLEYCFE